MKWREADRATVTRILANPAYAGVYRYGLTEADPSSDFRPDRAKHRIRRASASVWLVGHHEPYITLDESAQIRRQLTENRNTSKPYPGRGEALLQGLMRCTVHNLPFRTFYRDRTRIKTGPQKRLATYRCDPDLRRAQNAGRCSEVCARAIDPTIEADLLQTLTPPSVDDVRAAATLDYRQYETEVRTRKDDVRQARQKVADLEQELDQIGADQPLYRQRLRQRIEVALRNLEKVQADHQQSPPQLPPIFTEADVESLKSLLADLPSFWRHPTVTAQQRKALLRAVIQSIDVTPTSHRWAVRVEWVDGTRTHHDLLTHEGVLALIRTKPAFSF